MLKVFRLNYQENIFIGWILEIIFFPIWWYTFGLLQTMSFAVEYLRRHEQQVGFLIWFKNIFVPMYGQTDIISRLVSFFVRSVQVLVRGAIMSVFLLISMALVVLWLAVPVVALLEIFLNLNVKIF